MSSVVLGFGLGFLVALQLGPMSLLLIRSTLRSGLGVGLAIGAGIALVDALYAAAGAAGAASVVQVEPVATVLGLVGAGVLVLLGVRTLLSSIHVRAGLEGPAQTAGARRAFVTSLGATASNPATVVSWAAIFSAASAATGADALPLVVGVALGSATWVTVLACLVALLRRGATPRAVAAADVVAGSGLVLFGGALGYRSVAAD